MRTVAPIDVERSLENLKLERDAIVLYDSLAAIEKQPRRAEAFRRIAGNERRHADIWATKLEQLGADTHACFRVEARRPDVDLGTDDDQAALVAEQSTLFTARVDPRSAAQQGAPFRLAVDPAAFHFFDVESGRSLLEAAADAARPAPAVAS